jgi:hypothetical protein
MFLVIVLQGLDTRPSDPFRFSQATLEDTQEDELNAILGELSALQMSLDREIKQQGSTTATNSSTTAESIISTATTASSIKSGGSSSGGHGSESGKLFFERFHSSQGST